jgi:hypothetical protein
LKFATLKKSVKSGLFKLLTPRHENAPETRSIKMADKCGKVTTPTCQNCIEENSLVGCSAVQFGGIYRLLLIISCLVYSLKVEELCASETSGWLRTTRRHNPQERCAHNHCCEDLRRSRLQCPLSNTRTLLLFASPT